MNKSDVQRDEKPNDLRYVNVLDYLVVIARHSKFLVRFVALSVLVAVIVLYLLMSKWYKATAVIMPPKQQNTLGLLSAAARATSSLRSLGLGGGASDDLLQFQTILQSQRCFNAVIERFDLVKVYHAANAFEAGKQLGENLSIGMGKEEVSLEINVYDTDRMRAAEMTNFFVETLDKIYRELSTAEARSNREFLEQRYQQNLRDLKAAEDSLKTFQKKFGIYSVPDQLKAAIEAAAAIQSQIALKEVQMAYLEKTTTPGNNLREETSIELGALRRQMASLQSGDPGNGGNLQVFPPFQKVPDLGVQYLRYYREVDLQGKILELLLPLYEQAKIEEKRDTPSLLVLDRAVPPEKASKPRRLLITAIVLLVSFVIGTVLTFFVEYLDKARREAIVEDRDKISQIRRGLNPRNWLR